MSRGGRTATMAAFLVLGLLLGAVFLRSNGAPTSPLDVPYIVYPVLVWIAMLSGPRRTALAAGITVAVASLATTRGLGPFDSPYQLQTFLALCVLPVLLLQAVMSERDDAIASARGSDERYRAFVANSSEAIFRTELLEPMPVTLSPDEQVSWVRKTRLRRRVQHRLHGGPGCEGLRRTPWWVRVSRITPPGPRSTSIASAMPCGTATSCATSNTWCMDLTVWTACC